MNTDYRRSEGGVGIPSFQKVNLRKGYYAVRWDFQSNEDESTVNYMETVFDHLPNLKEISDIIIKSGVGSVTELVTINDFLEDDNALSIIKDFVIYKIGEYDKSNNVNSLLINSLETWLDKDTRVGLMNSTKIEKDVGHETTTLWFGPNSYNINCDMAISMLLSLELYALLCYNKTAEHKAKVLAMDNILDISKYNYTLGYPEKLNLTI